MDTHASCSCPQPSPDILYWEQPDQSEAVLVKPPGNSKLLNPTGLMIWKLCDGTRTPQDILEALKVQYAEADEHILVQDLDTFIEGLLSEGFLWMPA